MQAAIAAFGSVEIVVNNAGQARNAAFADMPIEEFQAVIDTHLGGAFYVTQPTFRHMIEARYGRIIFTSSAAGMFGSPWQANYDGGEGGTRRSVQRGRARRRAVRDHGEHDHADGADRHQ